MKLTQLEGFKFVKALVSMFKKTQNENKTKYDTFYSRSKGERVITETEINDVFESIYTAFTWNIEKVLGKYSDWITDSVICA